MNPAVLLEIVNGLLDVTAEVLRRLPDYDQRLRRHLLDLQMDLYEETQKAYGVSEDSRDEAAVAHIMKEISLMIQIHKDELGI